MNTVIIYSSPKTAPHSSSQQMLTIPLIISTLLPSQTETQNPPPRGKVTCLTTLEPSSWLSTYCKDWLAIHQTHFPCPPGQAARLHFPTSLPCVWVPDDEMWAKVLDTSSPLPGPTSKAPTQSCTPPSPICQVDINAQGNLGSHV